MTNSFPNQPQAEHRVIGLIQNLTLSLALLFLAAGPKPAAGEVSEYGVKAAYIYNFTQFVRWPKGAFESKDSPLVIGIVGDDPFGTVLDEAVKDKSANGHPLTVKRLGSFSAGKAESLSNCQILFIAYSEKSKVKEILQSLKGSGTLTVSEIDQFSLKGGAIQFDQEGQKITITLSESAAKKSGLSISSQLLQVAKLYKAEE